MDMIDIDIDIITYKEDAVVNRSRKYFIKLPEEIKMKFRDVLENYLEFMYVKGNYSNYQSCDSIKIKDIKINELTIDFSSEVECHRFDICDYNVDHRPSNQLELRVENG